MTSIPGCFAAGEADYQYHGANRLGANSLLSATYSGGVAGRTMREYVQGLEDLAADESVSLFESETQRQKEINDMMVAAFDRQWRDADLSGHLAWIARLLQEYYDPMYEYQLQQRGGEVLYRGDRKAVVAWAQGSA